MTGNGHRFKAEHALYPALLGPGDWLYDWAKTQRHLLMSVAALEEPDALADLSTNLGEITEGSILFGLYDEVLIGNDEEYFWYIPGEGLFLKGDIVSMLVHPLGFDIFDEEAEGTIDGSNTGFATSAKYIPGTLQVIQNGVWMDKDTDYTESTTTSLEFNVAPATGDVLRVNYTRSADKIRVYHETPTGTINGVNTSFTVAAAYVPGTIEVFLNGATLQFREDFFGGTKSFDMTTAPATGDDLVVAYQVVANTDWVYQETPTGAIDGANKAYDTAADYANLAVIHNGLKMTKDVDYAETDANTFTMTVAPAAGDTLWTIYGGEDVGVEEEEEAAAQGTNFDTWLWDRMPLASGGSI
jgi:hypothetical protein